jgi:N-acetylglucosamine-6-phosphate deacetylase
VSTTVTGRLVLEDRVVPGRLAIDGERIEELAVDRAAVRGTDAPFVCPGFVDIHVHGWGGHDATVGPGALDAMAGALLAHGVTSFLPTAETAALDILGAFAGFVRASMAVPRHDAAEALGFHLEGPFISKRRAGAQNPA